MLLTGAVDRHAIEPQRPSGTLALDPRRRSSASASLKAALHGRPPPHLRPAGARRRVRPAQRAVRAPPAALVRLLRPPPDRPADVARDGRPAGGPLLPRLRADLLLPARPHRRRRDRRDVLPRLAARADRARDHAGARRARVPLQPRLAPGAARRAAEAGRRRDRRRGEHRRRPRRQVVRAGAGRAGEVRGALGVRLRRRACDANRQRAFYVPLLAFLPLLGAGRGAARRRPHGRERVAVARRVLHLQPLLAMLVMPLRMLGMWIGQAQRATASGERIFEVLDEPEEIADRRRRGELPPGPGAIRFEGVVRLRPGRPVLRGHRPRARARADDRADRAHRLGQDDARLARAALLRRDRRAASRRRRRRARRDARVAAARDRRDLRRTRSSSRRPCARTSRSARPTRPTRRSSGGAARRRRTSSSSGCPRATTRSSASAGSRSPAASASGSRSRARSSSTRGS